MRKLWLRWLALLAFVAVLGTVFVMLGRWQLARLAERKQSNAVVAAHEKAAPIPFEQAFRSAVGDGDQWVRVTATGTYDPQHELVVRYRHRNGAQGFEVVTPLRAQGRTVLVDRGFQQASPGETPRAKPAPTGTVTVVGYVRRSERGDDTATVPVDGAVRLISSEKIGATLPYPVVDGYLSLISSDPPQDAALLPLEPPALDEGPHFSYALQWFTFCGIAVLGLVVFVRGDLRERRQARARAAAAEEADHGSR